MSIQLDNLCPCSQIEDGDIDDCAECPYVLKECKPKTKIKIGFKSKNQSPLFMVWREYYEGDELVYGEVLFTTSLS